MDIELLGDLLYGPARVLYGSRLSDENLLEATHETFGAQAVCIVRNWMVIDVLLSDRHESLVKANGLQPTVLYGSTIGDADEPSRSVVSGFQYRYEDCFFASEHMLYVLAGRGSRKFASVPAVFALSQQCSGEFRVDDGR